MSKRSRLIDGLPVVDATKDVFITVNTADVNGSKKLNPEQCTAARAGKRLLGTEVKVYLTRTYIKRKDHWVRFITPQSVSREITSFDRGSNFSLGDYVLKAPSERSRLGAHRGHSYEGDRKHRRNAPQHRTADVRDWGVNKK